MQNLWEQTVAGLTGSSNLDQLVFVQEKKEESIWTTETLVVTD